MGGNDLETVNVMALEVLNQCIRIRNSFLRDHMEAPTGTQGGKENGVAQIRRDCGNCGKAGISWKLQSLQDTVQVVE